MIMGVYVAALAVMAATVAVVLVPPHSEGAQLRDIWHGMVAWRRMSVGVLFLLSFGAEFRALAASAFATQQIQIHDSVGLLTAFRSVHRPQLRLFWLVLVVSLFAGPLWVLAFPFVAFFAAPALPVAILESKTAFASLKRGEALIKGHRGRIALLVSVGYVLGAGGFIAVMLGLDLLQHQFGQPWFLKPVPLLAYWILSLIPQLCMVALTLNYLDQRRREDRTLVAAQGSALGGSRVSGIDV